jgi:hypothetical protein
MPPLRLVSEKVPELPTVKVIGAVKRNELIVEPTPAFGVVPLVPRLTLFAAKNVVVYEPGG